MEKFTHLHFHSDGSIRDGLGTIQRSIKRAKDLGADHLALTDHGTLANAIAFTIEAERAGIKPILGLEGYLEVDGQIGHITLLADGNDGWKNLVKLNNLGHESENRQPAFSLRQLLDNANNLICLTGCVSSPLNTLPPNEAIAVGSALRNAFGSRLFAEVMAVSDTDTWSRPLWLAEKLGIRVVMTNDVHFPYQNDAKTHNILTRMKSGFEYNSKELWMKGWAEMKLRAHKMIGVDASEWLERAWRIGEFIKPVDLKKEPKLPHVSDADRKLGDKIEKSLEAWRLAFSGEYEFKKYRDRAEYELEVIRKMDYSSYFLILEDLVKWAKESGIRVGAGRGSGAGSLVLFLLNITEIDPLKYGLSFERFLNPERTGMPDVDLDFDSDNRDRVLAYMQDKYGSVPIATYSRYSHKSLVHDLAKVYKVPKKLEIAAADYGERSKEFAKVLDEYPGFDLSYKAIYGQIRHKGKHAGGVIVTESIVPVERISKEVLAAAWSEGRWNELSYAGVVKFDLLGLSILSVLNRLEKKFGRQADSPAKAPEVFDIFKRGKLAGIFQFSGSSGIKDLTMRVQPDKFDDLIAINALFRPGAIDAGTAEKYPDYKRVPRQVPEYIQDILEETYGVVCYQEQVMEIFQRTVGGTYGEADLARRIIVKSKPDDIEWVRKFTNLKRRFIAGAIDHGLTERDATNLWHELETHSRYSFNKSHSTAYSQIAWETAWWSFKYPSYFFAELLNIDPTNSQEYISALMDRGIEIEFPHVNESGVDWVATNNKVFIPLTAVKFLGLPAAHSIVNNRPKGGYVSLPNFMELNAKKDVRGQARQGLYYLKAFSGLKDNSWENLELGKKKAEEVLSRKQAQSRFLGFILPTLSQHNAMMKYRSVGWEAGIVDNIKEKTSAKGDYKVYYLTPQGVFWSRDKLDVEIGSIVAVNKTTYGSVRSIDVLDY